MSLPREVVPGRDYMITRRYSERRPDDETNNAFIYCLALAVQRSKVEVIFSEAMANHAHTGIHDPDGNFPVFTEYFHGLLARCQNARPGPVRELLVLGADLRRVPARGSESVPDTSLRRAFGDGGFLRLFDLDISFPSPRRFSRQK